MSTHTVIGISRGLYCTPEVYADEAARSGVIESVRADCRRLAVSEGYVVLESGQSTHVQTYVVVTGKAPTEHSTQPWPPNAPVPEGYDLWYGVVVHVKAYDPAQPQEDE